MLLDGPYFDELQVGQRFDTAPSVTLSEGRAAVHQSIVGDRLDLALDDVLAVVVLGAGPFAHPAFVWDTAIGQSTLATRQVKANLFYRGLVFRRAPMLGDTLTTTTEVVGLRQNRPREGRAPTGVAALRVATTDQEGRTVLDFWRAAMLPLRHAGTQTGPTDDLDSIGSAPRPDEFGALTHGWHLEHFHDRKRGVRFNDLSIGATLEVSGGDVVSSGPELARLTLNVAAVHHDELSAGGQRLVYGGHTIGVALGQACRALPGMVTVTGWHSCNHIGPVHEGDTLYSAIAIEQVEPLRSGGGLAHLRSRVHAGRDRRPVLDWRFVAVFA